MDAAAVLEAARADEQRCRDLVAVGKPKQAERLLRRALAALAPLGDTAEAAELRCGVQITRALVEFDLYGRERADARLTEAAALIERFGLPALRVRLYNQRGVLILRSGGFRDSLTEFDRALEAADAGAVYDKCLVLLHRGVAHFELGDMRRAASDLNSCAQVAGAAGLALVAAKATHNLAFVEFVAGDLPAALAALERAQTLHPTAVVAGRAAQARAEVLMEAGLLVEARDALTEAARSFRADRLPVDLALVELDAARCALALGDARQARALALSAERRFQQRAGAALARAARLVAVQADVLSGRSRPATVERALELAAAWDGDGLGLQARMARLVAAEAALEAGDAGRGAELAAVAGRPRPDDPITGRTYFHLVGARLAAATGRPDLARRRIGRGLDELARYQASFGSLDLRTASAVHGRRLAGLDLTLALRAGRPADVFAAAERARAVTSRLPPVRPPDDPAAAELLAELRQTLDALRGVDQDRAASAPLQRRRRDLERRIVARSWTVSGTGVVDRPAALGAVRARLAERGKTMISYVAAGATLCAVTVGARVRLHILGAAAPVVEDIRRVRADLDVLATPRLPAGLRAAVRASLARALGGLEAALLTPLAVDGPLVVVSTGMLSQLPWASLPGLRGRALVVAPSATKWLASAERAGGRVARVVAIAGPDLERGAEEARAVVRAWAAQDVRTGAAATGAALHEAMASADVLHVAAHGVHQPENPLFSSLRMADGPVFAHELDGRGHSPEHVILSACEVGLSTVRPGDEALGLASVLLQLGTASVLAGVARVGDEQAEHTMAAYHERLAAGADSAVALAGALTDVDADVAAPFVNFGAAWHPDLAGSAPVA